jgi:Ankyrin repeats (3 copies)
MNPRQYKILQQLPPRNPMWMEIIRLLVEYNASVHDVVNGRSLTTLNLIWHQNRNRTLEFFTLLQDQYYVDFGAGHIGSWTAFTSAFRSVGSSSECLKFLDKKAGLDFSSIGADGRSLLHLGAEIAHEPEAIEYLCNVCPLDYINRQDDFGWTALHYAILFESLHKPRESLAKVKLLLRRGADPYTKTTQLPWFCAGIGTDVDQLTAFELCETLPSDQYEHFLEIVKECGHEISEEAEMNIFHEAVA